MFVSSAAGAHEASALTLRLQSGATVLTVSDNGPGDASPEIGVVTYNGSLDVFPVVVVAGVSKPVIGSDSAARLAISEVSATTTTGGTLLVWLTDVGFGNGGSGTVTMSSEVGGTTQGSTTYQGYVDPANLEFGTAGADVCTPGLQGPFTPTAFDNTATGACTVGAAFSMTIRASATLGPGMGQSLGGDLSVSLPNVPNDPVGCRFTGGGVDTTGNWNHQLVNGSSIRNGVGKLPAGIDRYQYGGQVGARTGQQPQPSGEWQHHQQTGPSGGFSFHGGTRSAAPGTRIVDVRCSDPGFCDPARPAPAKQLDFDGIGTFSNLGHGANAPVFQSPDPNVVPEPQGQRAVPFTYHWFEVNIDDLGEPGRLNSGAPNGSTCPGRGFGEKSAGAYPDPLNPGSLVVLPYKELADCSCPDFYRITIYRGVLSNAVTFLPDGRINPASLDRTRVIYEGYGYVDGGNLQIHPPTGYDRQ